MGILLIGLWWGNRVIFWEISVISFLPPTGLESMVWGLCAGAQHAVNFLYLGRGLASAKQLKVMAQDVIYSPWGGAKGPWLCFMAKLLFCLAWPLSFFLHFFTPLIKFALWNLGSLGRLKLFYKQELEDTGQGEGLSLEDHTVSLSPGHLPEPCLLPSDPEEGPSYHPSPQPSPPRVFIRWPTILKLQEYTSQVGMLFDITSLAFRQTL